MVPLIAVIRKHNKAGPEVGKSGRISRSERQICESTNLEIY